jgi:SAM-dependent methyltransferase
MSSTNLLDRSVNFARRIARGIARRTRNVARSVYRPPARQGLLDNLASLQSEVASLRQEQRGVRNELAGQLSFFSHDMMQQVNASGAQLSARLENLQSQATEDRNRLIHLDTSVHSRLNEVVNLHFPAILEQVHEASAFQINITKRPWEKLATGASTRPRAVSVESFDALLARARSDFPTVFAAWKERLDEHRQALSITETGNAANPADVYSRLFRAFVEHHAEGAILDVGCGPSGRPFYLSGYPSELVAGVDPLAAHHRDFEVVQGISEYLPWPDQSFATVVSATSLDHCLSLDRSLDEVTRLMQAKGKFLLWIGSVPGAPEFRPFDPDFAPADRFHLFHFDIAWFEPMLEQRFQIIDRVKLDRAGYSHVFYCLGLRAVE